MIEQDLAGQEEREYFATATHHFQGGAIIVDRRDPQVTTAKLAIDDEGSGRVIHGATELITAIEEGHFIELDQRDLAELITILQLARDELIEAASELEDRDPTEF